MVRRKTEPGRDTQKKKQPPARGNSKGRGSRDGTPVERLIGSIKAAASSLARQRSPKAARIGAILAQFKAKLDEALTEPSTPAASTSKPTRAKERKIDIDSAPTVATAKPRTKSDDIERVRIYTLDRVSGAVAKQITIREPIDPSIDPEDVAFRVGCLELTDDEPWTWVDGSVEGDAIRIYFPDDRYYGFPPFLDLDRPRKPQIGQTWRLRRTDGATAATYILRSVDLTEQPRPHWKHGDIVRAVFDGEPLVARFIRVTEVGQALVHWGVDGMFSEIPMEDVLASSPYRWTRELEGEDVEIEF